MRSILIVVSAALVSVSAVGRAQDFGAGGWLGGQNTILLKQLAAQLEQVVELRSAVDNVQMVVQAGNETLSVARTAYRQYQALRNYSLEDLGRQAKYALYSAFPKLQEIESDLYDIKNQGEAMHDGTFFRYWGRRDGLVSNAMEQLFALKYQSTIFPVFFPKAFNGSETPNRVDEEVIKLYAKTGQLAEWAKKRTALWALKEKAQQFVEEAHKQEEQNIELMATTGMYQMLVQEVSNSDEMLDLMKTQQAVDQRAKDVMQGRRKALFESMRKHAYDAFSPGTFQRENDRAQGGR